MIIKCGKREFDLNENDIIFDNGACYQITTKTYRQGWSDYYPVVAKSKAKMLIKDGDMVLVKEERQYTTSEGEDVYYRYYKINEKVVE